MTTSPAARPLRADARRNRDALVAAAAELFQTRGPEVSMLEIAEAAGVGVGTLYRHFPQRESLIIAVYRQGLQAVCDEAFQLYAGHPADEAIELWLRRLVAHILDNRPLKRIVMQGPFVAGWSHGDPTPPEFAEFEDMQVTTMARLLDAAAGQHLIGPGTEPRDLLRITSGLCQMEPGPEEAARLIHLVVDGLRYRRAS